MISISYKESLPFGDEHTRFHIYIVKIGLRCLSLPSSTSREVLESKARECARRYGATEIRIEKW